LISYTFELSQGHDFRPDYTKLGLLRKHFPQVPIIAVTATASDRVQLDVCDILNMKGNCVFFGSTANRPNLTYEVRQKRTFVSGDCVLDDTRQAAEDKNGWTSAKKTARKRGGKSTPSCEGTGKKAAPQKSTTYRKRKRFPMAKSNRKPLRKQNGRKNVSSSSANEVIELSSSEDELASSPIVSLEKGSLPQNSAAVARRQEDLSGYYSVKESDSEFEFEG
jgi:hypothetical protein